MRFCAFLCTLASIFIVPSAFGTYLQISAGKGVYPLRLKAGVINLDYQFRTHPEPTADGIDDYRATIAIQDSTGIYLFRETPGSVTGWFHASFLNPKEQTVYVWAQGGFILLPSHGGGLYRALDDGTTFSGDAVVSGSTDSPTPTSPPAQAPAPVPTSATPQIHALIISGQSNVASVVRGKVQVTGGLIALGRASQKNQTWDPGVQIIPDPELLSGSKIPPVTPNLIDVRIVRFSMSARFQDTNSNDK